MKPTYTNLILDAGELIVAPAGYTGRHELVRVEHPWHVRAVLAGLAHEFADATLAEEARTRSKA